MQFVFCQHDQLKAQELEKIVELKKIHWDYSFEEHKDWIKRNIKGDDIHVLMYKNEELVAYLNLINTEVIINDIVHPFIGIGNVCSSEKEKGYGSLLIKEVNKYLEKQKRTGILFCKDSLISFYSKQGWILLHKINIEADFLLYDTMIFNLNKLLKGKKIYIKNEF